MAAIFCKMIPARHLTPYSAFKLRNQQAERSTRCLSALTCSQKPLTLAPLGILGARAASMSCEADEWTKRCGQAKLTRPPCCSMPNAKKAIGAMFGRNKKQDDFSKNCEGGRAGQAPCSDQIRIGFKPLKKMSAEKMLFYKKECCPACLPELPRFDELYYKVRQLGERCYTRTWTDCPKPRVIPKLVCCYENEPYEMPKRPKCSRPPTACPWEVVASKLQTCRKGGDPNCVKIRSDCCCPARDPPTCVRIRNPLCTTRMKAPGPSFSECNIKVRPLNPSECRCLNKMHACELHGIVDYNKCS